jgi:hypothetical protein
VGRYTDPVSSLSIYVLWVSQYGSRRFKTIAPKRKK